ncbi:MAG: sigma-54-dependent Fis family transcriptional regulator [Planctomycetes bacterium]|nr:sigma-54-dependent Fis family transcriptional regulator [Planctomycetota bacterium]
MLIRILISISDAQLHRQIRRLLQQSDAVLVDIPLASDPLTQATANTCDLMVMQIDTLDEKMHQLALEMAELPDNPWLILITDSEDPFERTEFLASGGLAVLPMAVGAEQIVAVLEEMIDKRKTFISSTINHRNLLNEPRLNDFYFASPSMREFLRFAFKIAASEANLLLLGETGVGKEHLARAIHRSGSRATAPFVPVNCGSLSENLLESDLFGHEKGSFTGANHARRGAFELAHKGTIFLDEIADLPYQLQVRLLRAIQDKEIQRVGAERAIPVDVRIMAATNRDLRHEVDSNRFRQDLYYRLNVISLTVPPLRERREDIPALVSRFVEFYRSSMRAEIIGIRDEALRALVQYDWPGNVRELANIIERSMLICEDDEIDLCDFPDEIRTLAKTYDSEEISSNPEAPALADDTVDVCELLWKDARRIGLDKLERTYFTRLLETTRGRIREAARRAGVDPRSINDKMRRYNLHKEDFKHRNQPPNSDA